MGGCLLRYRYLAAALIFALVVALRLPFATTHLWAWDSVLYARALEQGFHVSADPAAARPHPPGYLWYVGAAALARGAVGDSNAALVVVSILASAAGAALLFLVALRYVRPAIALVVALAYAASPLVWMYSEVAYPYTVLSLVSLALGALLLERRSPLLASLAFGVASGARQDVLVLLAPLWLWSVWPASARALAVRGALLAAGALTWIAPTVILSGGPVAYMAALAQQTERVAGTYSAAARGVAALAYNAGFTLEALAWGLGLLSVPLVVAVARWSRDRIHEPDGRVDPLAAGLALWIVPGLAFYTLVHIGEWGYVLSIVPALLLASGAALDRALPARLGLRWALAGAAAACIPAAVFLLGDGAYAAVVGDAEFSAVALARHDVRIAADVVYMRSQFAPGTTVIVTREDHLLVRYYLPEFRAWYWDPDPYRSEAKRHRAMRPTNVVVLTPGLQPLLQGDVRRIEIFPGVAIAYVSLDRGNVLELVGERYVVRDTPGR